VRLRHDGCESPHLRPDLGTIRRISGLPWRVIRLGAAAAIIIAGTLYVADLRDRVDRLTRERDVARANAVALADSTRRLS